MLIKVNRGRWLFPRLYNTNGDYRSGDSRHHPWPGSRGPSRRTPPLAPVAARPPTLPPSARPTAPPRQHRVLLLNRSVALLAPERTRRLAPGLRRRLHPFESHLLYTVRSTIVSTLHRLGVQRSAWFLQAVSYACFSSVLGCTCSGCRRQCALPTWDVEFQKGFQGEIASA